MSRFLLIAACDPAPETKIQLSEPFEPLSTEELMKSFVACKKSESELMISKSVTQNKFLAEMNLTLKTPNTSTRSKKVCYEKDKEHNKVPIAPTTLQ